MKPFDKNETGELIAAIHSLGKDKVRELVLVAWGHIQELETTNSPEIPDGWVACSERMPREGDYVIVAPDGGVTQCVTYFWEDCPINGKPMWFTHSEECEPVPLAEFTHWMPLPAAPRPEK